MKQNKQDIKTNHVYVEDGEDNIVEVRVVDADTQEILCSTPYPTGINKSKLPASKVPVKVIPVEKSRNADPEIAKIQKQIEEQNKLLAQLLKKSDKKEEPKVDKEDEPEKPEKPKEDQPKKKTSTKKSKSKKTKK